MATKPWLGAIKEPIPVPKNNPNKPSFTYEIDFVYGFRTDDARMNLYYNSLKQPVYMTAAMGVIYDSRKRTQKIFGGGETDLMIRKQNDNSIEGHTDDITALAMSNDRTLVATGQVGVAPFVFLWDSVSAEKKGMIRLPKGTRGVSALAFEKDGNYL